MGSAQHSNPPRMACNSLLQENPNARGNGGSRARVSRPRSRGVARRTQRAHHALAPKAPARESLRSSGLSAARRGCKTDPLHARRAAICTNWLAAPSSLYLLCYVQRVISVEGAARIWRVRRHHPCAMHADCTSAEMGNCSGSRNGCVFIECGRHARHCRANFSPALSAFNFRPTALVQTSRPDGDC